MGSRFKPDKVRFEILRNRGSPRKAPVESGQGADSTGARVDALTGVSLTETFRAMPMKTILAAHQSDPRHLTADWSPVM